MNEETKGASTRKPEAFTVKEASDSAVLMDFEA